MRPLVSRRMSATRSKITRTARVARSPRTPSPSVKSGWARGVDHLQGIGELVADLGRHLPHRRHALVPQEMLLRRLELEIAASGIAHQQEGNEEQGDPRPDRG